MMNTKEVISVINELRKLAEGLVAAGADLSSGHLNPYRGDSLGVGSTIWHAEKMIEALQEEQQANPRVLAENLSDRVLSVTYDKNFGGEYVIVKTDCGTIRVLRERGGLIADIYDPVMDEHVAGSWETEDNLRNWHFND
jgi:hypothetical protein